MGADGNVAFSLIGALCGAHYCSKPAAGEWGRRGRLERPNPLNSIGFSHPFWLPPGSSERNPFLRLAFRRQWPLQGPKIQPNIPVSPSLSPGHEEIHE